MRVLALDASSTKTGIVYPDGRIDTLRPPPSAKGGDRLLWWATTYQIVLADNRPDLVVIEQPFSRYATATATLQRTYGVLLAELARVGCVVQWVPPATLKLAATGSGKADKPQMILAARALGYDVANDDEADACLLFHGVGAGWWVT